MQAIIFDMDGTLIDTERISQASWRAAASELGIEIPERILHAFVGLSMKTAHTMIDDEFGDSALTDRLFARRNQIYGDTWIDQLELKPGAREAIGAVHQRGLKCALATSSERDRALFCLEHFGLADAFDATVFHEDIAHPKPAPDVYLTAAKRLDVPAHECGAVEDSFNGIRAAAAAGMTVFMVPDYNAPTPEIEGLCTAVLPSLTKLPGAIDLQLTD